MEYSKALKQRDRLENDLTSIQWKVNNSDKIKTNMQSWYYKKEAEYIEFLKDSNLTPLKIRLSQPLPPPSE